MADDYYQSNWSTPVEDTPQVSTEWTNPYPTSGGGIDYTKVANDLGLPLVDTLLPTFDIAKYGIGYDSSYGAHDAAGAAPDTSASPWLQSMRKAFSEVSGDTWAKILGGAAAGAGNAYLKGKELDVLKQNADTNRMNANLAQQKDKRAAESAHNLKWRMGLIGKAKQ